MAHERDCIVLIGMPAAGKSTIGVLLAKELGKGFLDTDIAIQEAAGRTLQAIVDGEGQDGLRRLEDETIRGLTPRNQVVATGGSAVYSGRAMAHLRAFGPIVHLRASLATIHERIGDPAERGLARREGQGIDDLYRERLPLYAACADVTIDVDGLGHTAVVARVIDALAG